MTILPAGTFNVSEKRKPITAETERAVRKRYRLDHRPALTARLFDTDADDFIPPQNDPAFIELVEDKVHDQRTFGRKPNAAKTVTTRGSDVGERARTRDIRTTEAIHQAQRASRAGNYQVAAEILASVSKPSRLKPKRKIPSRPLRSRNTFERRP